MNKLQYYFAGVLFAFSSACFVPASASGNPTQEKHFAVADTLKNTLLWEISGNGLDVPSYFYGSMHMLCKEDAFLSENLVSAISNSHKVYLEIDMDDLGQIFSAFPLMMMRNDTTLKDLLTEEEYDRLAERIKGKMPLPISMLHRIKPMFLSALLGQESMSCDEPASIEMMVMQEAKRKNKKIEGLETMKFQAELFDRIPYGLQAKELLKSLDTTKTQEDRKMMDQLTNAYRTQDLDAIEKLTSLESMGGGDLMTMLLDDRNKNWVEMFPEIAKQGSTVFCVGAGHLPGKMGVLQLLRDKGYTVKPVSNRPGKSL